MYDYLFDGIIFKELDFINVMQYKNDILSDDLSSFPVVFGNDVRSSILEGVKKEPQAVWVDYANGNKSNLLMLANYNLLQPKICEELINCINENMNLSLKPKHVILIKSVSTSYRHIDTIFRRGAINCFLENGNLAATNFYKTLDEDNDNEIIATINAEDGKSYLLNGAIPHQVVQEDNSGERLFLSVSIPLLKFA